MCHVTHINGSCHTYKRVMLYVWLRHGNKSRDTVSRDLFTRVTWLIRMCDMTHLCVWRDTFIYVILLIHVCVTLYIYMCDVTLSYMSRDSFTRVARLTRMRDMTHSRVWHDTFICETWLIHACDVIHSCVTWLICMCDVTDSNVWRIMCYYVTHSHMCECVTSHICICVTHSHIYWHMSLICHSLTHTVTVTSLIHICYDVWMSHVTHNS